MNLNRPAKSVIALAATFVSSIVLAAPVNPNDPASYWSKTPFGDRQAYAKRVSVACQSSNCGSVEIRACMDEALRPPLPPAAKGTTIGEAAVGCIAILRSQQ